VSIAVAAAVRHVEEISPARETPDAQCCDE
jgi:hypothetical protein